jgi:NAD(P)-dependent dehydrogenase (short-subunit alcohol dehydrogenase family)
MKMTPPAEIVLVTGGTGSLGGEMCAALRRAGHTVYFTSRSSTKIAELEARVNAEPAAGAAIQGIEVDLLADGYGDVIAARFQAEGVRPTALVNNARNLDFLKVSAGVTARSDFAGEFAMGVIVPYELALRWTGEYAGSVRNIVNIASVYGVVVPNRALYDDGYARSPVQYGVVKAAMVHLTKELAVRLAGRGVRVNCISYGGVKGRAAPEFVERYSALTPQARMLEKDEVAGPLLFLLSPDSRGMTGENLVYDGGFSLW